MLCVRRGGLLCALLLVGTTLGLADAKAQDADEPPPAEKEPVEGETSASDEPDDEPDAEDAPADATETPADEKDSEIVKEGTDGDEWITPDVAAEQEQQEENAIGDVDEVIINYDDDVETGDVITDAEGKEVPDVPVPEVSKTVEVQDPDQLEPGADKETGIQGQVVSRKPKKVLPDAPVLAKGKEDGKVRGTITDERGRYRLYLPPGRYTLRSYYDLYHGARWDNIDVQRGKFKRINFVLDPISDKDAGVEEQEVVYLADTSSEAAQLNIRKETVTVQDAISAEEIKRAGDSTARGAASRVVGVTIDGQGRIIIRGLADRYNNTLLNGVPIPGVDPDIPSVKLDVFPSEVVSNLAVVKVPRPDLPGAFAGGLVLIDTNNYPRDFQLKVGVSLTGNSLATFQDWPHYEGGRREFLGFDDGTRALPSEVGGQRLDVGNRFDPGRYATPEQRDQVGRTFPAIWNPLTRRALPYIGLKASVGDTVNLKKEGRRAGYLVSFIYDYKEVVNTGFNDRFRFDDNGESEIELENFDYRGGSREVLWGTFGSGFLELDPDNFLNVTSLFSRLMDDDTILQLGTREDEGQDIPITKNSYNFIGRSIFFNQLTGDHRNLGNSRARLEWNAVVSTGKRDEPDRRQVQQRVLDQRVTQATRFFSDLEQLNLAGKTSTRFPIFEAFDGTAYGSIGIEGSYLDREFTARRFAYQNLGNANLEGDPDAVLGPGVGTISFAREVTRVDDSYTASNALYGGFAQLETPMAPWLNFLGLMRFEVFTQQVESLSQFAADTSEDLTTRTDRTDIDPLPSASFQFKINDDMFVKLGYGMTVIRPAIRELAPFTYVDFLRGWVITGNPNLQRTRIQNAEARYEYYFGKTDLFSATAFYKYFTNNIEFVIFNEINGSAGYANADSAWLVGGEFEIRLGFERFSQKLDRLFFVGNVAVMVSETTLPEDPETPIAGRRTRPLYNQSPYVTNLSLRFDDPDSGVTASLVYNAFGRRIVEAGASRGDSVIPDVFEQAQHWLNLIVSWKPQEHLKLGFKWKNIALTKQRYQQGNEQVFLRNWGSDVSISAEYSY